MRQEVLQAVYFEDVLPKTGWGLYYKFMLGMACACSFSQAAALSSVSFAIPLATCEHYITEGIIYSIYISLALGRGTGGAVLDCLYDIYGRKYIMCYNFLLLFISSFIAAFAYNYYVVILAVFLLGAALECNSSIVKVHLAEVLPKNKRGYYLSLCDCFWTMGYVFVSVFACCMKNPSFVDSRAVNMRVTTWRMIFAICGGLNLTLACASALLEESPRFFLHVKKYLLAVLTLKQFYAINTSNYGENFPVKELDLRHVVEDYGIAYYPDQQEGHCAAVRKVIRLMYKALILMFAAPFRKSTFVQIATKTPVMILGLVEINILLTKCLNSVKDNNLSGIDVIHLETMKNGSFCMEPTEENLYANFFIISSNILLGQITMMFALDRAGRKLCLVAGLIVSSVGFVTLLWVSNITARHLISCFVMFGYSSVVTTLSVVNIETFPTGLRGTSHAVSNVPGIMASILVIRFYHLFGGYFFSFICVLLLQSAIASLSIVDLKKQPMVE